MRVPGGNGIMKVFREALSFKGYSCTEIYQHSFYGWGFDATRGKLNVFCLIQGGEEWLLLLEQKTGILSRVLGSIDPTEFSAFQDVVEDIFRGDNRFSNVLWHVKAEYDGGKAINGDATARG